MRLIDADSLKDYIDCGHLRPPTELCFSELDVCNMIDKRPTIDAVEVVMCKDCRYANECHKSVQYTRNEPNTVTIGFSQIEWCSKGERKEE